MARKSRKNLSNSEQIKTSNSLKTVMYLRISVEDNEIHSSIDNQREIIKKFLSTKSEFMLVNEFIDNGKTGTNFNRNGFLKMMEYVENGAIDCIIVKDLSRFGRNMIDTGHYIEKYFPMHNVRFIAINDDFDSKNKEYNSMLLPLKNIINETYARDISFKVRKEVKSAMERGEIISSSAPYGYTRVRENKKNRYEVDLVAANNVKYIFDLILKGLTYSQIIKILNDRDIPNPRAYKKNIGVLKNEDYLSDKWNTTMIKTIVTNKVYIGTLEQGKRSCVGGKEIKVPKEKWVIIENNHQPIIEENIFNEAQLLVNKLSRKTLNKL